MADSTISEAMREIALKRWEGTSIEDRRRNTAAANAANRRRPRKTAAEKIAELEARFESELTDLRAKVIDLEQRVAA